MGIKHCGKSTQGKILAKKMGAQFYDTDDVITEQTGKTPRQIYTESGEEGFKTAEKNACQFVAEKIMAPKFTYTLIPRACEYVTLPRKWTLCD